MFNILNHNKKNLCAFVPLLEIFLYRCAVASLRSNPIFPSPRRVKNRNSDRFRNRALMEAGDGDMREDVYCFIGFGYEVLHGKKASGAHFYRNLIRQRGVCYVII